MLGLGMSIPMSRSVSATTVTPLLDEFSTDSHSGWSVRKLTESYSGPCMKVREASGNTEQDIYFDSNGLLDVSALESHCNGADGFVSVWYDQTDNASGLDLVQTNTANQPKIASSGSVITQGSIPAMEMADNTVTLTIPGSTADFKFLHDGGEGNVLWVFTPYDSYPTGVEADEPFETGNFAGSVGVETTLRVGPIVGSGARNSIEIAIKDGQTNKSLYPAVIQTDNNTIPAGQNIFAFTTDANATPVADRLRIYINDSPVINTNTNSGTPNTGNSANDFTILGGFTTAGVDTYWQEIVVWDGNTFLNNSGQVLNAVNSYYSIY